MNRHAQVALISFSLESNYAPNQRNPEVFIKLFGQSSEKTERNGHHFETAPLFWKIYGGVILDIKFIQWPNIIFPAQ